MNIKEFLIKNREIAQLVYGVILIILIPLLIAFNTVFIIKKYNHSMDVALQRQALSIGRTVYALIKYDLGSAEELQEKIKVLQNSRIELEELAILAPVGDNFKIIASSQEEDKGKILSFYYFLNSNY